MRKSEKVAAADEKQQSCAGIADLFRLLPVRELSGLAPPVGWLPLRV